MLDTDERYCSLIKPAQDWTHWTEEAESYHQLSRQIIEQHGADIETVAKDLNRILDNRTVYSDGWAVDHPWIIRLFHYARITMSFRISPLEMILSEAQMEIWHKTKDQVTETLNIDRHRASNDALIIQQTYIQTLQQCR